MSRFLRSGLFILALLPYQSALGQSLDIGGIEIVLGEPGDSALARLRKSFDVAHIAALDSGNQKSWMVLRFAKEDPQLMVGQLWTVAGLVVGVRKQAAIPSPRDAQAEYTKWDAELRRRTDKGGCKMSFETRTVSAAPNSTYISALVTNCGPYSMSLNAPADVGEHQEHLNGGWSNSQYSISMEVRRP